MKFISEMSPGELAQTIHQYRRLVRALAGKIKVELDAEFTRASGLAICPECGLDYFQHAQVGPYMAPLTMACDGKLLKL